MTFSEVQSYRHPDEFPPDVEELFALGARDSSELGTMWYRNFVNTIAGPDDLVRFYVLREQQNAVAVLPVMTKSRRRYLHNRLESLSNYYTSLYAPVLRPDLDAQKLSRLIDEIKRLHIPMASLRLQPMDPTSGAYRILLSALRRSGLVPFEFFCFGNWFWRGKPDWQAYLSQRTSKLRSNVKRMDKKLLQDGGSIEIVLGDADGKRAAEAFDVVYRTSWKQDEPYAEFVPGLIAGCAAVGSLRMGIAWLNAQPIAAQLWIVANGKAEIYKVAYDPAFKDYSPGTVLTARLMQHVMERDGVTEVDYLTGDDPYKQTWMGDRRERWGIVAYNPRTVLGLLGAFREASGRRLKKAGLALKAVLAGARGPAAP